MNVKEFTSLLNNPNLLISKEQTHALEEIVESYPYFQAARALHLKGLKTIKSFKYNNALRDTAAHTADRSLLFDLIHSEVFTNSTKSQIDETANLSSKEVEETAVIESEEKTYETDMEIAIGTPLEFNAKEKHSFAVWLELTSAKPIIREESTSEGETKKSKKTALIDRFLENNPKIIARKDYDSNLDIKSSVEIDEKEIMTETLARVYTEQKKYEQALKAYSILCLKYPEKNGFFAGQMKAIKKLQKENKL